MNPRLQKIRPGLALILAIFLLLATAALIWFTHRTTVEWRRATEMSVQRRANEVLALLATALEHDMTGVQSSVLLPLNQQTLTLDPPYDLAERFGRAFARFPYPESFFAWQTTPPSVPFVFNRSDRQPPWDRGERSQDPYPVVTLRDPPALRSLFALARHEAEYGTRFAVMESRVAGTPYQTVTHMIYNGNSRELFAMVGFTVNLDWATREYFPDVIAQVQRIGGRARDTSVQVFDESGTQVVGVGTSFAGPAQSRTFPLLFLERSLWSSLPPERPQIRTWTVRVAAVDDPALVAASRGAELTVVIIAVALILSVIGLVLTARAVRAEAALAALRSEFVSSVTHELKTPLAVIQLVGDTLTQKRYTSHDTVNDYAKLLSKEVTRLTRLIDNLLQYARLEEGRNVYSLQPVSLASLVTEVIDRFDPRFEELGFAVSADIPADLPKMKVDSAASLIVIDNIVDNATKYAQSGRSLTLRGCCDSRFVTLEVEDRGEGIAEDEVTRVFEKFYRSRTAKTGGSGLGLSIARRIMTDLGGRIELRSTEGMGTTVLVSWPVAEDK